MIIIGFDCASQDKNIGITYSRYLQSNKLSIIEIIQGEKISRFFDKLKAFRNKNEKILICFDTPLGWPVNLMNLIGELSANEPNIGKDIDYEKDSEQVFKRLTDRLIKEKFGFNPLEIGADKIARTTFRTLEIISRINEEFNMKIKLAWKKSDIHEISMIEVYPKATIEGLNRLHKVGFNLYYRSKKYGGERKKIIEFLTENINTNNIELYDLKNWTKSHKLDSLICCYTGKLFIDGELDSPEDVGIQLRETVFKEGWIWTIMNGIAANIS